MKARSQNQERLDQLSIDSGCTLLVAFRKMDADDVRLLCVLRDGSYAGIVSAGDIQRAIIANFGLETPVGEIMGREIRVAHVDDPFESVKAMMLKHRTEFMPVLDDQGSLLDVHFWDEVFSTEGPEYGTIDIPVVIMAGGKGTRLKPFTNILPKALFPLGDQTILEVILDKFKEAGCSRFTLSVNYKHEFIRTYFEQLEGRPYVLDYIKEDKPLGTGGSLRLIRDKIQETFFVSNCDIVIDTDYSEIVDYHRKQNNEITLVAALKHFKIPYGTLETAEGGQLTGIQEKPELNYLINTGLYLLESHLLADIPENTFYHITDLIEAVRVRGGRVGVYPVSEKSWCDIGEWEEYRRTMSHFGV